MDNDIVIYQSEDGLTKIEVKFENETVWLTQQQMAELFQTSRTNVVEHIQHIYEEGELEQISTCRNFRQVRQEGNRMVSRNIPFYNLDMIISLGYRVKSIVATRFRQWANEVLKNYLLQGYSINQRLLQVENRLERQQEQLNKHEAKIDFFVQTSLPPIQGVFYNGQIFDAYNFVNDLIRSANKRIVLIDNYIDDTVLTMFDKRQKLVEATIFTAQISKQLQLDITKHNEQYRPIEVKTFRQSHDRFLIIDDAIYLIGASLKDLGKKWFGFSLLQSISVEELLDKLMPLGIGHW